MRLSLSSNSAIPLSGNAELSYQAQSLNISNGCTLRVEKLFGILSMMLRTLMVSC